MTFTFKISQLLLVTCILFFLGFADRSQAAPLTIAANGKSTFSIVAPNIATQSVNDAAAEMQRDIAESTGAKLPIIKDNETVNSPFISLGSTKQAEAVGISAKGIADEAFRIVTKAGNLYIIGLDTTAIDLDRQTGRFGRNTPNMELHPEIPGPAFTKNGGFSQGTANGVYSFLEDSLDVRWLMPGDIGRDVPPKSTFVVEETDSTIVPMFTYRVMTSLSSYGVRNTPSLAWRDEMKLGYSFRLNHNHSWADTVPADLYQNHPEWFAMNANGTRPKPAGTSYKLETTNPELVKFVAEAAIKAFKADPELNTFSLSPTDSGGWSLSPESQALDDAGYPEISGPTITPLILKFYTDVSKIIAKEYPQGKLAGYFYSRFVRPPSQGDVEIPANFVPVLTSIASGYGFYTLQTREEDSAILNAWAKVAPPTWFYYAFPTWLRARTGMVTPAAPNYMNALFKDLAKNHIKGVFYYGNGAWDQAALANYVAAKMLWNPQSDAVAIQHEWLTRAYGPQAGAIMEELYNKMDESWFSDYFRQPDSTFHNVSEEFFSRIYGAHYQQMETLILQAEAQPMTQIQKKRLRLISDNMRVLQWRLRNAGYLPAKYSSPYTINSEQVFQLMSNSDDSRGFVAFGAPKTGSKVIPVKVQVAQSNQESVAGLPNASHILLFSTKDEIIHLNPVKVRPGCSFLYYFVQDEKGESVISGILDNNEDITFKAKANTPYYFQTINDGVTLNPHIQWEIAIPGAIPAQASFNDGILSFNAASEDTSKSLYVYIPESLNRVAVSTDTGVLIQTQTTEDQKSQARSAARKAAVAALKIGLANYQGKLVQNFDRDWKFITDPDKTGVRQGFFQADFNDRSWTPISTTGSWQSQGFEKYHGTAWYRRTFTLSAADIDPTWLGNNKLLLFVGAVDGDAIFYLNGEKIAERKQSDFVNSWEMPFVLDVSSSLIVGKNTIAVQVTKDKFASGLYKGVSLIAGVEKK
jgi:hypothetical protein